MAIIPDTIDAIAIGSVVPLEVPMAGGGAAATGGAGVPGLGES